ncbi:SusC/RagA family TonB-linked outer membrane protein [Pedobacter metabolipauper]|uniref:TonB-linked SusC/RagA family outer membrane protein n=1 Tax=Pedobacter metabolipauper TaxID=425513 RepID=A0A4R6SV62_9SPHI|nr:TonB-dependent receptor [Pedobacter metabolipauper]TDQ08640.1 TonB-linked SusC/RagA family outer membrane protein [Pedobacter metabolipauper]
MKKSNYKRSTLLLLRVREDGSFLKVLICLLASMLILSPTGTFANAIKKAVPRGTLIKNNKIDVSGRVVDAENKPIPGATVRAKTGKAVTITDTDGKFTIKDVTSSDILVITYQGFTTRELPASADLSAIQLTVSASDLEEVVVVGYGTTQRKDLTGSVSSVSSAQVKDLPVSSIDQKLIGQVAGVQISAPTGAPGGGVNVKIRGTGSITAGNNPLFVVDGFAISNSGGQVYNPLNVISPDDIESVTILKDASSTAIYGSRGSNGVVVITTKRGKTGPPVVSVNSYIGSQQIPQKGRPQVLNGTEYAQFRKEMIIDDFASRGLTATDADIPVQFRNPSEYGAGTDWYDAVLRTAMQNNIDVSLRGGSENTRYSASFGRLEQEGTIRYTDYKRYSLNFNIESDISKKIKLGISVAPSGGIQNRNGFESGQRDILTRTLWLSPIVPIADAAGNRTVFITSPGAIGAGNPLNTLEFAGTEAKYFRGLATAFAEYKIFDALKARYSFNYDYTNNGSFSFSPSFVIGETGNANPNPSIPSSSTAQNTTSNWLSEITLSYDKNFGTDHRINAVAGYTAQEERYEGYNFGATNYPDNLIETINASTLLNGAGAGIEKWALISYLARVNYTFKDRYLLTATVRSDGSSRFGANNRYGVFPSGAFAWRASQENFLKNVSWLSDLKVRASYGRTGNFNIPNYQYASSIGSSNYSFGGGLASGRVSGSIANENLTWEKADELDLGIDLSVLNTRLSLTLDYYNRITSSLLLNAELPSASGFSNSTINLGKVRNRGFEVGVSSKNLTGEFTWNTNANISINRNVVLELNPGNNNAPIYSGRSGGGYSTHKTEVGKPIGQFFGFVFDGLYRSQEELNTQPKDGSSVVGSVRYKDIDGNRIIEAVKDFDVIGNAQADFTYGFTNTFGYKNFDLNVLVVGSQGGQIMKTGNEFLTNTDGVFNVDRKVLDRWRSASNPGNGLAPTTVGGRTLYREVSSLWIEDASFLRIQNVSLGYNFKQKFITSSNVIKGLRVYASVQNLATFTKYSGANPEAGTNDGFSALTPGRDFTAYPLPRIITAGINMTF